MVAAKEEEEDEITTTFEGLGLHENLIKTIRVLKWETPTPIQLQAIPHALQGLDIVALAETGSGKTGAFLLPILHRCLTTTTTTTTTLALVLSPTRELARQIFTVAEQLMASLHLRAALVTGGSELMDEAICLACEPHLIIATPGRLVEHLEKNLAFKQDLKQRVNCLVLDEADVLVNLDFAPPN